MNVIGSAPLAGTAFPSAGLAAGLGWAAGGWESAATTPENCNTKNGTAVSRQFRPNMAALEWAISLATARSRRSTSRWVRFWAEHLAGRRRACDGMKTRHFEPSFISCSTSVQPGITPLIAGNSSAPRDRPSCRRRCRRSKCRDSGRRTPSSSSGFLPVPSLRTRYCKPLAVVFTPGFFLFSARNSSPFFLLIWPLETPSWTGSFAIGLPDSSSQPGKTTRAKRATAPIRETNQPPRNMKQPFPSVLRQKSAAT